MTNLPTDPDHQDDGGLAADVQLVLRRRAVLLGFSALGLTACTQGGTVGGTAPATGACVAAPEETQGPFPADGSSFGGDGGPNALSMSGIERSDITPSLTGGSAATGVPLTIQLQLVDADGGCAPLAGRAVYIWHCDAQGRYSLYNGVAESWCRGLQVADDQGRVTFKTVFPGAYRGRYPHIHFEIYPDRASAASYKGKVRTSQLALPEDACAAVYQDATAYPGSAANLAGTPLDRDGIFADNTEAENAMLMLDLTGSVADGYVASATVGYSAKTVSRGMGGMGGPPPNGERPPGR